MKLLTEVHNCPGTLALASFLVAFLEGVAFCLPHFCGPINNWAYGTADGLCPIPGTVTSKCDHRFLHFGMNLVTVLLAKQQTCIHLLIRGAWQKFSRVNIVTKKSCKRLSHIYIQFLFLTFLWLRRFFSGTEYALYVQYFHFSMSFLQHAACMSLFHFPNQAFPVFYYVFKCYFSYVRIMDF